jgi:hypothetical protein
MNTQDQQTTESSKLPRMLRSLFWEYDFEALTWESNRDLVIARVLAHGTWDDVTWLRSRLGDTALREWIVCHQGRELSPQQLRFWELILDLPHQQVSACLQVQERRVWENRVKPSWPLVSRF